MTWRDDLLPASLDGVPFFFEDVGSVLGRDGHTHEYYGNRPAWREDTGPATKRYVLDVYIVGPNYHLQRDLLIEVLNSKGPYNFVHPFQGPAFVRAESPTTLNEKARVEGGMVRIGRLALVESGLDFPLIFEFSAGRLSDLAGLAAAAAAANTRFSILGAIDSVLSSIRNGLFAATSAVRKINGKIGGALNSIDQISSQLNEFDAAIDKLLNSPASLMGTLNGLVLSAFGVVKNFIPPAASIDVAEPTFPVAEIAAESLSDILTFETAAPVNAWIPADGPQGVIEAAAHAEITVQMKAAGVIGGSDMAASLPFTSASQAASMMSQLSSAFDDLFADPGLPPPTYERLATLRAAMVRNLLDQQAELPRVVVVTPPSVIPALVLAHELYGDASRADELVRRNKISHPGFVPAEPLEVIVDA